MTPTVDAVLAAAVELARAAALEMADADVVGEHVGVVADDDHIATHHFTCLSSGYRGWQWAVTLVRTPGSDQVTVDEVVLLPGSGSLLAPAWVPWSERVRPGDLSPGDLYPTSPDDPRLEPGYTGSDVLDPQDDLEKGQAPLRPEQWQLGLGRERVLSALGRDLAANRWDEGDFGPGAAMAKAAPGSCSSCAFLMPVGGALGQAFGLCANEFGADGRVVSLGYGCGAHSNVREIQGTGIPVTEMIVDENVADMFVLDPAGSLAPDLLLDTIDDDIVAVDLVTLADDTDLAADDEPEILAADDQLADHDIADDEEDDADDDEDDADDDDDDADEEDDDDADEEDDDDDISDIEPDEVFI